MGQEAKNEKWGNPERLISIFHIDDNSRAPVFHFNNNINKKTRLLFIDIFRNNYFSTNTEKEIIFYQNYRLQEILKSKIIIIPFNTTIFLKKRYLFLN